MLHHFNVFLQNKASDNCAKMLEEECIRMFGTKSLNDEHDCNVVGMNSLNIHSTNDDCTSHDENVSYKHVNFCGVHWVCKYTPNREDRFCKRHTYLEAKWLQERLDVCSENLNILSYMFHFFITQEQTKFIMMRKGNQVITIFGHDSIMKQFAFDIQMTTFIAKFTSMAMKI